jgi:hypothetical protein
MSEESKLTPLPVGLIAQRIHLIRGHRVILDADLAAFYGETTKRFNQQVTRNANRFPADFMFELDTEEFASLRLQIATSNVGRGGRRYAPRVFTEHGAIMVRPCSTALAPQRSASMSFVLLSNYARSSPPIVSCRIKFFSSIAPSLATTRPSPNS